MVSKFLVKEEEDEEEGGGLELQLGGGVRREVHVRKRDCRHVRSGGIW